MVEPRLLVGTVVRPHGLRGDVIVHVESEAPERFAPGSVLGCGEGVLTVETSRPHTAQGPNRLIVRFWEIAGHDAAEELRGAPLTIAAADAAPPPEGAYYPHQLEGLAVVDESGATLGTLARVEFGRANDIWVVNVDGEEVLVPAVAEFVVAVDLDARRIVMRPIPGMFAE